MEIDQHKFLKLSTQLKFQLVEEFGHYLRERKHLNYHVELFQLDNFYVEIWRSIATNQVYWIEVVNKEKVYATYLEQIQLEF